MTNLNDNYHQRKCYLERNQVPTQSVMKDKMSPALAKVYFKSMTPKLKILAGLEPPMKGGGSDWFVPPKDLLEGRAVLKPVKKEYLKKLGCNGIGIFGEGLVRAHHKRLEEEKRIALQENDANWKKDIEISCRRLWDDKSREAAQENTSRIVQAFHEFSVMFTSSINNIEQLLLDASIEDIKRVKEETYNKMTRHYRTLLQQQATMMYDRYAKRLDKEKEKLKAQFIESIDTAHKKFSEQLHDINVEKHIAIEKLRCLLESQNLACQIYVAMKERQECEKEMIRSKHKHSKQMKVLDDEIIMKNFEIKLAQEKEKNRKEFKTIWLKKICHVVKRFQDYVSYCLNALPEHADFFINMEKLMLLQLNEAVENPDVESIIVPDEEKFHTPVPRPHPFYLFCDKGYKTPVDQHLCPKHCTSSATQLPVIVVNKKYIYAACDNLEEFADKMKEFIDGSRGNDADFDDDHDYTYDVPVKYSASNQLDEMKMQSSLMQVLQNEFPNVKELPIKCCLTKVPYCFCSPGHSSELSVHLREDKNVTIVSQESVPSYKSITTRFVELEHERQPKWESYLEYVRPKRCKCPKTAKKHLLEHLPPYMRNTSAFETLDLPGYEPCSIATLKHLVSKGRGVRSPPPPPEKIESKTKDISTQYSDQDFDFLCTCFSDDEVDRLFRELKIESDLYNREKKFQVVDGILPPSSLEKHPTSFAMERAKSLKYLLDDSPELKEIFIKADCKF